MCSVTTEWRMSNSPTSIIATSVNPHHQRVDAVTEAEKTILGNISFLGQSTVRERCQYNIKSKTRYQAGNQNSTTYTLSTLECDWQSATCYQQARVPDFSASIISLFAHDELFGIHHEWGWVLSVWEKKKAHSGQPLTPWLSSNVRWWSTSRSGWNMLSRTALKDFTSWSSSSRRDSEMLQKNNIDF